MSNTTKILKKDQKDFVMKFEKLSGRYAVRQIWDDWITMAAASVTNNCSPIPNKEREKRYLDTVRKYKPDELKTFAELFADMVLSLEENPEQDFLGEMYMAVGMGSSHAGQFFTPYHICALLAKLANIEKYKEEIDTRGFAKVTDPACGAGATLIAAANECRKAGINYQTQMIFVGQDIDYICACMCYLQLSLLGCPGYVIMGNTLSEPIPREENIWYTPLWYLSPRNSNGSMFQTNELDKETIMTINDLRQKYIGKAFRVKADGTIGNCIQVNGYRREDSLVNWVCGSYRGQSTGSADRSGTLPDICHPSS